MNNSIKFFSMILAGFLMNINLLLCQLDTLHTQTTYIKLNGETEVKEVIMPLRDSLNSVNIIVASLIGAGELTLEIFDPAGEKHGNFSLGCQMNTTVLQKKENQKITLRDIDNSDEKAFGNLFRTIKNPIRGAWKAKITNKGAVGNIQIRFTDQSIKLNNVVFKIKD
jgi:hypothetical protein